MVLNIIGRDRLSAPEKALANPSGAKAENGVTLMCGRCRWRWKYRGKHTVYANCPNCYAKVKILEGVGDDK